MANKIEILIEVDPSGRGSQAIKKVTADVHTLGSTTKNALGQIGGGLGIPIGLSAATAALAYTSKVAIDASIEGENAQRRLAASSKEAGLAFSYSKGEADKLAESLALSETQAEGTEAKLIQLARVSGKLGDLPDIRRKFQDLAAAYGLAAGDIETLTNQLLSGQDEALNRLGIADPSKLYKVYADNIGKAVNELTMQEQAQARLNAVLEKGALHLGAANERLTEGAGKWAQLSAKIADAKRNLGDFAGERGLALINVLTPGYDYSKDEDRRQRAREAEDKRLRDEAARKVDAYLNFESKRGDLFKDPSKRFDSVEYFVASQTLTPEAIQKIREKAKQAGEEAAKAFADASRGDADRAAAAVGAEQGLTPKERRAKVARVREEAELQRQANIESIRERAQTDSYRAGLIEQATAQATEATNKFLASYKSLFKDKNVDLAVADFAERQFNEIKKILPPDEAESIEKSLAGIFERAHNQAAGYLKGIRAEAEKLFDTLAERYAGEQDNPFVKIFVEAKKKAEELERTFGILGEETVKELQAIEAAHTKQRTLATQLDVELAASSLKRQAAHDREAASIKELTRLDETRLGILQKTLEATVKGAEYEAKAAALRGGRVFNDKEGSNDKAALFNRQANELLQQKEGLKFLEGQVGQAARAQVDKALVDLFEGADEGFKRQVSKDRYSREAFADAYAGVAKAEREEIERDKARAERERREYARDQALGKEQLDKIKAAEAAGLNAGDADKRRLGLDRDILGGEGLRTRAAAGEREADRLLESQAAARAAVEKSTEKTEALTTSIDNLASAMADPENRKLLIEIVNRSKADVKDDLYGSLKPAPASANRKK